MKVIVKQKEGEEVPTEVMAQAIVDISEALKKLRAARLTDRAIVILVHDVTNVRRLDIKLVMNALTSLSDIYLRKKGN